MTELTFETRWKQHHTRWTAVAHFSVHRLAAIGLRAASVSRHDGLRLDLWSNSHVPFSFCSGLQPLLQITSGLAVRVAQTDTRGFGLDLERH